MRSLAFLSPFTDHNDYPFITLQLVNSAPFHMPHSCKRYPFKAEPPYVGHCRKYPLGGGGRGQRKTTTKKFHFNDNTLTSIASHADVLRGSSRVPAWRTRDETLRTSAWEAIRSTDSVSTCLHNTVKSLNGLLAWFVLGVKLTFSTFAWLCI